MERMMLGKLHILNGETSSYLKSLKLKIERNKMKEKEINVKVDEKTLNVLVHIVASSGIYIGISRKNLKRYYSTKGGFNIDGVFDFILEERKQK